ncbi:NYN domain-containing protein [[Clostridium] polysaccharolyticum]|jgi:uncharacterized protein (TIGR00288 family)|uniref:TIGR00288 family protein n=1 Tax=[Clostridium] polysaccharolyticum TaxID=29364 RepID=A0A1I0DM23_9FIRM|nr:NYN domain-containing protein [[Clostridium] polysaccharolyticum]SET32903.1 TIGR00288 family protein [[Clostridium] polysaccharolyticum]
MNKERIALLIDAENISPRYVDKIMKEIVKHGNLAYKRIYRDWTSDSAIGWKDVILEYGLNPVQQYSYTSGKNATDFAVIIEAMDILYTGNVDIFCLATSDSDFTRLAVRLKEAGKQVIGMGEKKVPKPFSLACDCYVYLDMEPGFDGENDLESEGARIPKEELREFMEGIIRQNDERQKTTGMGQIGSELKKRYPEFSLKDYDCRTLSQFIEQFDTLSIKKDGHSTYIARNNKLEIKDIEKQILDIISLQEKGYIDLGELNQKLKQQNEEFSIKQFGFSKFSKFLHTFNSIQICDLENGRSNVSCLSNS